MKYIGFLLFAFSTVAFASPTPEPGTSQQQVLKQLGQPESKKAPIGQPPISRWEYQGFTVYFEKQRVIHTVKH